MRIKIHGGTVRHTQRSLCTTCRYATIVRGHRLDDEIVECAQLSSEHNRVRFPVASCSGYLDRSHPSLREMEDAAWILRTDAKRKRIGFVQARELKPSERLVLPDEWPF
jgi:hypothetical protein